MPSRNDDRKKRRRHLGEGVGRQLILEELPELVDRQGAAVVKGHDSSDLLAKHFVCQTDDGRLCHRGVPQHGTLDAERGELVPA